MTASPSTRFVARLGRVRSRNRTWPEILVGAPALHDAAEVPSIPGPTRTRLGRWFDTRPFAFRALIITALVWQAVYLTWRIAFSWDGAQMILWAALLLCEMYGLLSLMSLSVFSWSRDITPTPPVPANGPSVDVYVCTYSEPVSVLRPTLIGAKSLTYPHTTYLLDDGCRPEMKALAAEMGAIWVPRESSLHAKAGNINNSLPNTTGDLVLILDADHVAQPNALDALVGYFDDPSVALVQTPHDFYNHDSVQHYEVGRHEQSVFFEVVCPGKDRHGAAFWCGSGGLVRRVALLEVGGVATETVAEDFHTTVKMLNRGWTTRYHDEVLFQGLGPHDLEGYLLQRDRWARGNLSVLHTPESPLALRPGLSFAQRLSFASSLFGYAAGPVRALLLLVLGVSLWTGLLPLRASLTVLLVLWLPSVVLSMLAGNATCRGHMRAQESVHFELLTAEVYLRSLRCLLRPSRAGFKVTPKEGVDLGGLKALKPLRLVVVLGFILGAGIFARGLEAVQVPGIEALPDLPAWAAVVIPVLAVLELRRVLRTCLLVVRRRQRRSEFRFPCNEPAVVFSETGRIDSVRIVDASLHGMRLVSDVSVPRGEKVAVDLTLPTFSSGIQVVRLPGTVRAAFSRPDGTWTLGVSVDVPVEEVPEALVEFCFVVCPHRRLHPDEVVRALAAARPTLAPRTLPVLHAMPDGTFLPALPSRSTLPSRPSSRTCPVEVSEIFIPAQRTSSQNETVSSFQNPVYAGVSPASNESDEVVVDAAYRTGIIDPRVLAAPASVR